MAKSVKELKIRKTYFEAVISKDKTFEIRWNDREYKEGDILVLKEYEESYTGRVAVVKVTYMLDDFEGLMKGYVAMSIELIWGGFGY